MGKFLVSFNRRELKVMTPEQAAYMAGLLDGEGTLTAIRVKRKENRNGVQYQPHMSIANTDMAVLESIREDCGNGRLVGSSRGWLPHHKIGYVLRFSSNQIRFVLPQLVPFLRIKKRQAELVLELLDVCKSNHWHNRMDWPRAEDLRLMLKALNYRGVKPLHSPNGFEWTDLSETPLTGLSRYDPEPTRNRGIEVVMRSIH